MNHTLDTFRNYLIEEKIQSKIVARPFDVLSFSKDRSLVLPEDLAEYFEFINGTEQYDSKFFSFYSLKKFKSVEETYSEWEGVPNFKAIAETLTGYQNCFVIADYSIHVLSYCIRLFSYETSTNEVYAICGSRYEQVATSFTQFIGLYLNNIDSLFF